MSFYFAWVDATETTFSAATHARYDESVFNVDLSQKEGDFALLQIDIKNPRVGLLNLARKQWAWLARDVEGIAEPLLLGRLIGVPTDLNREIVRLAFVARPADYEAQKLAVAETLKVSPFWDPVWVDPRFHSDPDVVLEGRPAVWHAHRTTHVVSASDIITGEGASLVLNPADIRAESLSITFSQRPANRVVIEGSVAWDQEAAGTVDLSAHLAAGFVAAGSSQGPALLTSYTGEGLIRDWPEQGARIGAGWSVGAGSIRRVDGELAEQKVKTVQLADGSVIAFPLWSMLASFPVDYNVSRSRSEVMNLAFGAAVQRLYTDAGEDDVINLKVTTGQVGEPIDPGGATPLADVRYRSYFLTERGKQSIENLICRGRTALLRRARAVDVTVATRFETIRSVTCRDTATIVDPRLPGGYATGKVTGYRMAFSGARGAWEASLTISCTIGTGEALVVASGTGGYVDDGYADSGYQITTGGATAVAGGDIAYSDFGATPIVDDGVDLTQLNASNIVLTLGVAGSETEQTNVLNGGPFADTSEAIRVLNEAHTEFCYALKPLTGGPFQTVFNLTATDLMVPQTIDLTAAGTA